MKYYLFLVKTSCIFLNDFHLCWSIHHKRRFFRTRFFYYAFQRCIGGNTSRAGMSASGGKYWQSTSLCPGWPGVHGPV